MRVLWPLLLLCLLPMASAVSGPYVLWNDAQFDAMANGVREPDPRADLIQWRMTEEPKSILFQILTRGTPAAPVPQNTNPGYSASLQSELRVTTPTGEVSRLRIVYDETLTVLQDGEPLTRVSVVDPAPERFAFRIHKADFWPGRALAPLDLVGGAVTWLNASGVAGQSTDRGPSTGVGVEYELDGGMNATTFTILGDEDKTYAAGPAVDWHNGSWQVAWAYTGDASGQSRAAGAYWMSEGRTEQALSFSMGNPGRAQDRLRVALDASGPAILSQTTVDTGACQWRVALRIDGAWNATDPVADRADCSLGATGAILVSEHGLIVAVPTPAGFDIRRQTDAGWETLVSMAGSSPRLADPRDPVVAWYEGADESASGKVFVASMSTGWIPEEVASGVPNDAGRVGLESGPRFDMDTRPDGRIGIIFQNQDGTQFRLGSETEPAPVAGSILDLSFDDMGNAHIASGSGTSSAIHYRTVYGHWRSEPVTTGRMVAIAADADGRVIAASTAPNGGSALQVHLADRSPFPVGFAPMGDNATLGEIPDIKPAPETNATSNETVEPAAKKKSPGIAPILAVAVIAILARRR